MSTAGAASTHPRTRCLSRSRVVRSVQRRIFAMLSDDKKAPGKGASRYWVLSGFGICLLKESRKGNSVIEVSIGT